MSRPYPGLLIPSFFVLSFTASLRAQDPVQLELVPWATDMLLPLDVTHAGDARLFVATQDGRILIVTDSMVVLPTPFLNISSQVNYGGEKGLLGLAFDPDYANNGFFYVSYVAGTGNGVSTISRFHVSTDPNVADAGSEEVLFSWPQPLDIHKAGDLDFGLDGHLYISLGDGGGSGDPFNNAQDLGDPLGNILRIDVSDPDTTYTIPPDNPYAGAGPDTLPEIWASGLRNPYRFGFDRVTGELFIGDVGQESYEELNYMDAGDNSGPNFGWRCYEANAVYDTSGCLPAASYRSPIITQAHPAVGGTFCALIGGRVYRGAEFPHLLGLYIYADFCGAGLWTLRPDGLGGWVTAPATETGILGLATIGDAVDGSLYVTNLVDGTLHKIVDRCPMDAPTITQIGDSLVSSPAAGYQWFLGGDSIAGADAQILVPLQSGSYAVVATFPNGCVLTSDHFFFSPAGIADPGAPRLSIHPLPAADLIILERNGATDVDWTLTFFDARGSEVLLTPWPPDAPRLHVDLTDLESGPYILAIRDARGLLVAQEKIVRIP